MSSEMHGDSSAVVIVALALGAAVYATVLSREALQNRGCVEMLFHGLPVEGMMVFQAERNGHDGILICALATCAVVMLLKLCPRLLQVTTLPLWQCVFFLLATAHVAPGLCPPQHLSTSSRLSGLFLTVANCALLCSPVCVVQHGLYLLVVSSSILLSPLHGDNLGRHLLIEVMAASGSCICVAMMHHLVEAQHCSSVEAQYLMVKQLAYNKLLGVFYEVVLEVDSELTIVSSEPELGLFLPHPAGKPIPSLLGTKLDALMPNGPDQQLLRQRMRCPPSGEEASVDVMHLTMRHGNSNSLSVELFNLHFQGLMGRGRHLLGVRAFGDEEPAAPTGEPCMTMRVDTLDINLPIVDISPVLQRELGGATPGTSLCQLVGSASEFQRRLQQAVNTVACSDELEPSDSFPVVLRPLGQSTHLQASCCVTLEEESTNEPFSGGGYVACLSFCHLAPVHRLRRRSGRSTSSSSGSCVLLCGTPRELPSRLLGSPPRAMVLGTMSL